MVKVLEGSVNWCKSSTEEDNILALTILGNVNT